MAEYKMGFIGTGNMGSALARAAAKSGERMLLANRTPEKAEALAAVLGAKVGTNLQAAAACEYIFLGVKPQMLPALLDELRPALLERTDRFVLVSMAAGVKTGTIRQALGFDCPVVRIMPNLPVASGTGVILLSPGAQVTEDELCELERLLQAAGLLMRMPEAQIDAGSAVSGCGPAYVYLFLDALANGGVACGLRYDQALALAAQTLIGAAGTALTSGKHPGKLQAEVCSPAGTTIAGVRTLEQRGFRAAAMDAVIAAYERTKGACRRPTNTIMRPPRDPGGRFLHLSKRGCIDWFRAKMPEFLGEEPIFWLICRWRHRPPGAAATRRARCPRAPLANPYVPFQNDNPERYAGTRADERHAVSGLDLPYRGAQSVEPRSEGMQRLQELQAAKLRDHGAESPYLDTHADDAGGRAAVQPVRRAV